jgi:ribosomal-protein-alanine N-acetyltransferase
MIRSVESPVEIETPRLVLTMPPPASAASLVEYFVQNRRHLERWSPPRAPGFYSISFWRWRLEDNRAEYVNDRALRLSVFERGRSDGPVVGQVSFTEIVRGPLQACMLGYSIDHRFEGRGLMQEALEHAIEFVFERLALHRVSANYMPSNHRSAALLRKLGFVIEGYARDYLYIDGAWRDHVLSSRVNPQSPIPGMHAQSSSGEPI